MAAIAARWHDPESVERALELKGQVSIRAAERITGIPHDTISGWWRNGYNPRLPGRPKDSKSTPATHCKRGHKLRKTDWHPTTGRRQCRRCKQALDRKRWRARNRVQGPRLSQLNYRAADVHALLERNNLARLNPDLYGTSLCQWVRSLPTREHVRFVVTDKHLTTLGLTVHDLDAEPFTL